MQPEMEREREPKMGMGMGTGESTVLHGVEECLAGWPVGRDNITKPVDEWYILLSLLINLPPYRNLLYCLIVLMFMGHCARIDTYDISIYPGTTRRSG